MTFELNQVLIEGEKETFSLIAHDGQLTCITGGNARRRKSWLLAMMGFLPVRQGYISIDGEPLTEQAAPVFRQLIAYAPERLEATGLQGKYEAPSVQEVFHLRSNRNQSISNGILGQEMRRIAADTSHPSVRLLAVAGLLGKPILLADSPLACAAGYLRQTAAAGKVVVVTSTEPQILEASNSIVELT